MSLSDALFLLLIPFAILAWYRFYLALPVLLVLLPAYLIRTTIFTIPTTWLELAIYILVIVFCVRGYWRQIDWSKLAKYKIWGWWLCFWLFASVIGAIIAPEARLAWGIWKGWIIDPLLLAGLIIYMTLTDSSAWQRKLVTAAWLSGFITSLAAIVMALVQSSSRLSGWYDSPNVLAMYLAPLLLITSLAMLLAPANYLARREKIIGWLGIIVMAGAILLTASYSGWFSLLAAYIIFILLLWARQNNKKAIGWILAVAISLAGMLVPLFFVKYNYWLPLRHYNPQYNLHSGEVRLILWREALRVIKTKPVAGLGLGQWQPYFLQNIMPQLPQSRQPGWGVELYYASLFPHNLWLTTWLYLGAAGLISLIGFSLLALVSAAYSNFSALLGAVVSSILLFGIVDTPIFKNDLACLWWIILAVTMVIATEAKVKSVELTKSV